MDKFKAAYSKTMTKLALPRFKDGSGAAQIESVALTRAARQPSFELRQEARSTSNEKRLSEKAVKWLSGLVALQVG